MRKKKRVFLFLFLLFSKVYLLFVSYYLFFEGFHYYPHYYRCFFSFFCSFGGKKEEVELSFVLLIILRCVHTHIAVNRIEKKERKKEHDAKLLTSFLSTHSAVQINFMVHGKCTLLLDKLFNNLN